MCVYVFIHRFHPKRRYTHCLLVVSCPRITIIGKLLDQGKHDVDANLHEGAEEFDGNAIAWSATIKMLPLVSSGYDFCIEFSMMLLFGFENGDDITTTG